MSAQPSLGTPFSHWVSHEMPSVYERTGPSSDGSHRNDSSSRLASARLSSERYSPIKSGICAIAGRQPASGLALLSAYSFCSSEFSRAGSRSRYFSWSALAAGAIACILVVDSICTLVSGNVSALTPIVNMMMEGP